MLDIFALRPQLTPTGTSVLVFQETPAEALARPCGSRGPSCRGQRLSLLYVAGGVDRPADLRGGLALLKRLR